MFLGLNILILVALLRLLYATGKPLLCAGIFVSLNLLFGFISDGEILGLLLGGAISFGFYYGWFWLLDTTKGKVWFWVLVLGLIAPVVVHLFFS